MCNNRFGHRGFGMRHDFHGRDFGPHRGYKVPVNILKNSDSYEMLIFAPDRSKEDFNIRIKGFELSISYEFKDELREKRNWIRQEFDKTSFERTFMIDDSVDTENIRAEYNNGILQLVLPIVPGAEKPSHDISVN
ncbi:Hsp20/alpha crystallin family protein [Dyadobacter sp. CY261]|uniref:Hsp20/alpha crystallin family protein n=1 Tax=Dyadobacter sp. CY261 TaxID=2907203 RepID=UPI001F1FF886|nr:Hsp20/alpha crystallin family protein [Dyadobacter sp. CY261]MCF0073252.1 Hsp20/alpha crystallin family protein [Dyadobacter sp. CY261]